MGVDQLCGDIGNAGAVKDAARGRDNRFFTWPPRQGCGAGTDDFFSHQCDRHTTCHYRLPILAGCPCWSTPAAPVWCSTARTCRGVDESAPLPGPFSCAPTPRPRPWPSRPCWPPPTGKLKTVALRPHLIWGPEDNHLVPRIIARADSLRRVGDGRKPGGHDLRGKTPPVPTCWPWRPWTATRPFSGRVYFISDDDPIGLWEMVDRILAAGGKPRPDPKRFSPRDGLLDRYPAGVGPTAPSAYPAKPKMTRFVARETGDRPLVRHLCGQAGTWGTRPGFPSTKECGGLEALAGGKRFPIGLKKMLKQCLSHPNANQGG